MLKGLEWVLGKGTGTESGKEQLSIPTEEVKEEEEDSRGRVEGTGEGRNQFSSSPAFL